MQSFCVEKEFKGELRANLTPCFFLQIFMCFSLKKRCRKFDWFSLSFEEGGFKVFDGDEVTAGLSYHMRYLHER